MMRSLLRAPALALALGALSAGPVHAQSDPPPAVSINVGAPVVDARGDLLGRVETVIVDDGQARQVLVRTPGLAGARTQLKSLPVAGLRPNGAGYRVSLRKAEFDALPSLDRR
jgi:hypothetical protein